MSDERPEYIEDVDPYEIDVVATHSTPEGEYTFGIATLADGSTYLCSFFTDTGWNFQEPIDLGSESGQRMLSEIAGTEGWRLPFSYGDEVRAAAERFGTAPWDCGVFRGAWPVLSLADASSGPNDEFLKHLSAGHAPRSPEERADAWELAYALGEQWFSEDYE